MLLRSATANIDDVRGTWRRSGDERGEEDTGFRGVIPITLPAWMTATPAAARTRETMITSEASLLTPLVVLNSVPWDELSA